MNLVILPNQLFDIKYLDKNDKITLWEHPQYFTKWKYNKRLMLHIASMNYYKDYLKKAGYKVKYVKYNNELQLKNYSIYDPIDKIKLTGNISILESPNFY